MKVPVDVNLVQVYAEKLLVIVFYILASVVWLEELGLTLALLIESKLRQAALVTI